MNQKIERLKAMAAELREMFPGVIVDLWTSPERYENLRLHECGDYTACTELARSLGAEDRQKQVHDPANPWFVLTADVDGMHVDVFGRGLPSTCRVERVTEKIPKTQTVDTGEFIEVERVKIVCGEQEGVAA